MNTSTMMDNSETRKGPASRFQNLVGKAKTFVNGVFKPASNPIPAEAKVRDRLKELLDRLENSDTLIDHTLIPEEVQNNFRSTVRLIVTEGFHDGVIRRSAGGAKTIAEAQSEELYARSIAAVTARDETLAKEIESRKKVVDDKRKQMRQHQDYQSYLQYQNKFNDRGNTFGEFLLYLGCGLFIFIADIPLAAEMLKRLFVVALKAPLNTSTLFGEPWGVMLTAIGVGLSTIYIKVCYDEFLGKKYGHRVISQKKFEELFIEDIGQRRPLTADEVDLVSKHDRFERKVKTLLLIFTLAAIATLGIFRGFAWQQKMAGTNIPVGIISLTLTLITLMFSIISGVCLSISLNAYTTYRRLNTCRKEEVELEKNYTDASKVLTSLEGDKAHAGAMKSKIGDGAVWKENTYRRLYGYYKMGFAEGRAEPGYFMQGLDFFDRVLSWREQDIANVINIHINI